MTQKEIFLDSEADAWYQRNREALSKRDFSADDPISSIVMEIAGFPHHTTHKGLKILEVGCGEGRRLTWLAQQIDADVYGVEPSALAVEAALQRGVKAKRGTADSLPFDDASFDVLIYGFCLYLCDREDLHQIASEANRVLKPEGWLAIMDFYSPTPVCRQYHHKSGVFSYKMDYRKLFDWHPAYTCFSHKVMHHGTGEYTDLQNEWTSVSLLRKKGVAVE